MKRLLTTFAAAALLAGCGKPAPPAISIWAAADKGDLAALKQHVAAGTDLNAKEPTYGATPLMAAALHGQTEAVRLLLKKGARHDFQSNDGATALHLAAFFCHLKTADLLLENGANLNARNSRGEKPLDTVAGPWNPTLEGVYVGAAKLLQLQLDIETIKRARPEMAELLRERAKER